MEPQEIDILLVEDNPDDLELAFFALRKSVVQARVHAVRDGEEAVNFVLGLKSYDSRKGAPLPKLIVLDLKLPKLTGMEVLKQIKSNERTRSVPVVVMTSSTQQKDMRECYHLGANSYIQKPIDFERFQKIMIQLGSYWLGVNESLPPGD